AARGGRPADLRHLDVRVGLRPRPLLRPWPGRRHPGERGPRLRSLSLDAGASAGEPATVTELAADLLTPLGAYLGLRDAAHGSFPLRQRAGRRGPAAGRAAATARPAPAPAPRLDAARSARARAVAGGAPPSRRARAGAHPRGGRLPGRDRAARHAPDVGVGRRA